MTKREMILQFLRDFFRAKTPLEIVEGELLEAQMAKMDAETSVEYYMAMVDYNQKRVTRLLAIRGNLYDSQELVSQPGVRLVRDQHIDTINPGPIDRI